MRSEKELLKSFDLFLDEKGVINLIFLEFPSDPETIIRQAELVVEGLTKLLDQAPKKSFGMLIDISGAGSTITIPGRAREIYAKTPIFKRFSKIAVVTPSLLVKILASAITQAGGKYETTKFFDGKQEALRWLKPTK